MKIKKIFNQNAVLVDDGGQEKVAIGKGIGFDRKRNDLIFDRDVERIFVMEPEGQIKLQNLLNQIDERFLFAAETSCVLTSAELYCGLERSSFFIGSNHSSAKDGFM